MTPLCTIEANNTVSGHKKFLSTCDSLFQCYLAIILRFDKLSGEVGSEVSVMMLSVSPPLAIKEQGGEVIVHNCIIKMRL